MVTFKGEPHSKDRLEERKKAFEAKYHQDEELAFKAGMRAAKLVGRQTAAYLSLSGDDAETYVRRMIEAALAGASPARLLAKVKADIEAAGRVFDEVHWVGEIERQGRLARQQISDEIASGAQVLSSR